MSGYLEARGVSRHFRVGDREIPVLRGVDLDIAEGEVVAIVGPSGAGKSTLLHIMGLLDKPSAGSVMFRGRSLAEMGDTERARMRNTEFAFVFQFYHLLPELTALENVMFPMKIRSSILGWPMLRREARERAAGLLGQMGMGERLKHVPGRLSGGERQRVAIARALMTRPEVVFCDEPTGNLDTATSQEIQDLLWNVASERKTTFVIVTHEVNLARRAHRVVRMVDGRIVLDPPPPAVPPAAPAESPVPPPATPTH